MQAFVRIVFQFSFCGTVVKNSGAVMTFIVRLLSVIARHEAIPWSIMDLFHYELIFCKSNTTHREEIATHRGAIADIGKPKNCGYLQQLKNCYVLKQKVNPYNKLPDCSFLYSTMRFVSPQPPGVRPGAFYFCRNWWFNHSLALACLHKQLAAAIPFIQQHTIALCGT